MLNSLHIKRSEDCNLNLITVGKLNTEVNSYVPFWQTTILNEQNVSFPLYLQRKECFTTVTYIRYISDPFYNYVHFVLLLTFCAWQDGCLIYFAHCGLCKHLEIWIFIGLSIGMLYSLYLVLGSEPSFDHFLTVTLRF
jgi:hypothetical protein